MSTVSNTLVCETDPASGGGQLKIVISEVSTDQTAGTSSVQVTGSIYNGNSSRTSTHSATDIDSSITGDQGYIGSKFNINLPPGASKQIIQHTFTVDHASDGTGSFDVAVHFSATGTTIFGDNKGVEATLTLTPFANAPDTPSAPVFSNILPTSLTVSWDPPDDDGGWPISKYALIRYPGDDTSGTPAVETDSAGTTQNLTGLTAGADYTFGVAAYNGHGTSDGFSPLSDTSTVSMLAGCWIRVLSTWKVAIPYVRVDGVWKMAVPWVRNGGTWTQTH